MSERRWRVKEDDHPDPEDRSDSTHSGRRIGMLIVLASAAATALGLTWLAWSTVG